MTVVLIIGAALMGFALGVVVALDVVGAALNKALRSGALFIRYKDGHWNPYNPSRRQRG